MPTESASGPTDVPLISICTPAYNGLPYIVDTIESVRRQTHTNWEMWICDDQSPDGTADAVEKHLAQTGDARVQLVRSTQRVSMAENWNRSLTHARGEFIKLLPQDDILHPDCLAIQGRLLRENPDVGFVTSGKEVIDASGKILFTRKPLAAGKYDWARLGPRTLYAIANIIGEPAAILFRAELLRTCAAYDTTLKYFTDFEILLRFLKVSNAYVWGEPLYQFRVHGRSVSSASVKPALDEYVRVLERYADELNLARRPGLKSYLKLKSRMIVYARDLVFKFSNRG